jgi:uncharacterized membrane protein
MNESERSELARLKQRHARMEEEMALLAKQLKLVESRLQVSEQLGAKDIEASLEKATDLASFPPPEIPAEAVIPPLIPPVIQLLDAISKTAEAPTPSSIGSAAPPSSIGSAAPPSSDERFIRCLCKHCGGHLEFSPMLVGDSIECPHCGRQTFLAMETKPVAEKLPEPPPIPPVFVSEPMGVSSESALPPEKRSFEMRLGTFWFVRVGVVMVLTGLVFCGNYAYQNYIGKLGPTGKVSLLYLASGILLGAGAWWQRKASKEALRNYGQVLFAGGLAAVYFTTYAAHHIETLRVIVSPLLDGALLLAWAGFMVWIADRKKSEVLALFAVGLAYYTSIITHVGSFTLYSNLILTIAAVFFLVRNRWAALSFGSLIATYVSYAFWRFFNGAEWHWATPEEGLWFGTYFLINYWIVFTAAVFLSKHEKLSGPNRATFLTLNNTEFFAMFLLTMLQVHHGDFWKFSLVYGSVLIALAEIARRVLPSEPLTKNSYLTQGLLLVTVGFIAKFTGLKLALLLGAESVVLLTLGTMRKSLLLQGGAYIVGLLAIGWGIDGLERGDARGLLLNGAVGAMMAFNAFWSHRNSGENNSLIRPSVAYFAALALISWLATTWNHTSSENFPLVLAVEAVLLTFSIYLLRMPEFTIFGQSYLLIAHGVWLVQFIQPNTTPPWWNPALLIAVTLGLSHWWQRQKVLPASAQLPFAIQGLYALALIGVLYFWLNPLVAAPTWLALTSLLAIGITAYGAFTRAWLLAAFGQIFLFVSAAQFVWQLRENKPEWFFPLAPIAALGFLSVATVIWFQRRPDANPNVRTTLLQLAQLYRWLALAMSIWWVNEYVPARERIWVFAFLGAVIFLLGGRWRNQEALFFGGAFSLVGFGLLWVPLHGGPTLYWPNLLAILALLGQQQIAKRFPASYPLDSLVHGAMIVVGGLSLWLYITCWICREPISYRLLFHHESGVYVTAGWSVLALVLFGCGIALRERVYRWLGLAVLACALGRVVIFDVWKLETIYRILSFMALGIVLLVLGFFYNKYQEKIKEWL